MEAKKWYTSKTLYVNLLAIAGDVVLNLTGHGLPAGSDVAALGIINMILRLITKQAISW